MTMTEMVNSEKESIVASWTSHENRKHMFEFGWGKGLK